MTVAAECNGDGDIVGMTVEQMRELGVEVKSHIDVFDQNGKLVPGDFKVGKIIQDVFDAASDEEKKTVCTANVPNGVTKITVKKSAKKADGHAPEHAKAA